MKRKMQRKIPVLCEFKDINYTISVGSFDVLAQILLILGSVSSFTTDFYAYFVSP